MFSYINMLLPKIERNSNDQKIRNLKQKINNVNESKAKKLLCVD